MKIIKFMFFIHFSFENDAKYRFSSPLESPAHEYEILKRKSHTIEPRLWVPFTSLLENLVGYSISDDYIPTHAMPFKSVTYKTANPGTNNNK